MHQQIFFYQLSVIIVLSHGAFPDYTPFTYPDSITQSQLCGQPKPSFFCDPNNVVNKTEKTINSTEIYVELDNELLSVRGETNCTCLLPEKCSRTRFGTTISVAVVQKMHLESDETSRKLILDAAKIFANTVRNRQNRGQCDDDILIFLSVADEVLWVSMGDAVDVNQVDIQRISEQGEIFFKKAQYEEGLKWMVQQYKHVLKGEQIERLWNWPLPEWAVLVIVIIILIIIASLMCSIIYMCIRFCRRDRRDEYSMVDH